MNTVITTANKMWQMAVGLGTCYNVYHSIDQRQSVHAQLRAHYRS